jgi:hypothetical protein
MFEINMKRAMSLNESVTIILSGRLLVSSQVYFCLFLIISENNLKQNKQLTTDDDMMMKRNLELQDQLVLFSVVLCCGYPMKSYTYHQKHKK